MCGRFFWRSVYEPHHDKTNNMTVRPAKTQISLGIRPVWSESSLCARWVAKDPSFLHTDSEDSDQTEAAHIIKCITELLIRHRSKCIPVKDNGYLLSTVEDVVMGFNTHLHHWLGTFPVKRHVLNSLKRNRIADSFFNTSIGISSYFKRYLWLS